MSALLATVFLHPMTVAGWQRTALLFPLCLSIAVVYKSIKCERPREVPVATLILWVTIVLGMYAVGIGLWGLYLVAT